MNDITITVVGTVLNDLRVSATRGGASVTSFRMASNARRLNRTTGEWEDGEATFFTVNCWRQLGDNVAKSLNRGDAVVVTGRLRVREWSNEERTGTSVEIEAASVGHDLSRGVTAFTRVRRQSPQAEQLTAMAQAAGVDPRLLDPTLLEISGSPMAAPLAEAS